MWKNRILAAAGALAAVAVLTFAVVKFSPMLGASAQADGIYRAAGVKPDTTVMTLDGNEAPADMFVYWLNNSCYYWNYMLQSYIGTGLDLNGDMPFGEESASDFIRSEAVRTVTQQLVLENLANEYGVTLSDEDEASVDAQIAQAAESLGGEENFRAELAKIGAREETYRRVLRSDLLYNKLFELYNTPGSALYADEQTLLDFAAEQEYITADHLLIMSVDPTTREPLDEATAAERRQLAEDLLWQLRDSRDPVSLFAQLADEYSEDPGREAYPEGYTFTHGTMTPAFEEAAYALGEYEFSDLVETEYGWHILLRKPLDAHEAAEAVREAYFDQLFSARFESAEATLSPELETMDLAAVYDALVAAQTPAA